MRLTTTPRVKLILGMPEDKTTDDGVIDAIVASVSKRAEQFMGRSAKITARTEHIDVERDGAGQLFRVAGFPISSITSVKVDSTGQYTGSESTLTVGDEYALLRNGEMGIIKILSSLIATPGGLQIVYTGGMATNVETFAETYPDITQALTQQAVFEYNRRRDLGVESIGGSGGNVTNFTPMDWLKFVRRTMTAYKRIG